MRRRSLLSGAAALTLAGAGPAPRALRSRTRPGQPGWPNPADWAGLHDQVGGNLVKPVPLPQAAAATGNNMAALKNPFFISDQAGGTQVSGWLGAWSPAVSPYAVAACHDADVIAAVNFARRHDLRLVIKGGGHSYLGTSNAPDSLLIWTHPIRAVTLVENFVPQGGTTKPEPAATIEAGARWMDAYDAVTTKAGRYVQGGGCTSVGVAGLVQSGGFGSFSKQFGTAAGNLLQADIVTADGRLRTVNAWQDPELFWALKGGGGGSLGVVTRLTLRTHDLPPSFGGCFLAIQAHTDAAFTALVAQFISFAATALMNPHWGESVVFHPDNTLSVSMVFQDLTDDQARRTWQPLADWVAARPKDYAVRRPLFAAGAPARGWWDAAFWHRIGLDNIMDRDNRPGAPAANAWWSGDADQVSAYLYAYDSVWMDAALLATPDRLAAGIVAACRGIQMALHFNKGLFGGSPQALADADHTATHPSVSTAFALAIIAGDTAPQYPGLPPHDAAEARHDVEAVAAGARVLRALSPQGGSYVSESNYFDPDWQSHYWGSNLPRLQAAKRRYDPDGLFTVHHGVGSSAWSPDGFTRL